MTNTRMITTTRITSLACGSLLLAGGLFASGTAAADCACFCVDGELKTMCTTVEAAQDNPALCSAYSAMSCPEEPGDAPTASYEAPEAGATNCRDLRVFDALRGVFTSIKACDVLSGD